MGVKEEELHPWQQHRMIALREAIDFIEHGQVPPAPLHCFNMNCQRDSELFEYKDERAVREFVVGGLCVKCQETMLKVCKEFAEEVDGAGYRLPQPGDKQPVGQPACIWLGSRWEAVRPGMRLRCNTTLFADADKQEEPIWVAGEGH